MDFVGKNPEICIAYDERGAIEVLTLNRFVTGECTPRRTRSRQIGGGGLITSPERSIGTPGKLTKGNYRVVKNRVIGPLIR
jgi:hypothetical protein